MQLQLNDISYSSSARSRPARMFIRTVENATGRLRLLAQGRASLSAHETEYGFWESMMRAYGLRLDYVCGNLDVIPRQGPLVLVANHPFGILDGLVMGHILDRQRGDFRIMAHSAFMAAPQLGKHILPIDFSGTKAAERANLQVRATATGYLKSGGCIGIFPGGTVSTASRPFARPLDPTWRLFAARIIQRAGATVVPIWFDDANSRLFQLSSHLNYTLRMALLIREFKTRVNRPVRLGIGAPISPETLSPYYGNPKEMMDFLRAATYGMADSPVDATQLGYEFEGAYRH